MDASSISDESNTILKQMMSWKELVTNFKRIGEIEGMCTLKQEVETRWNFKYSEGE